MRIQNLVAVGLALAFAGCGDHEYPAAAKTEFLKSCERTSGGRTAYCRCALAKIQDGMSYDDFKKENAAILAGRRPSRKLTDLVAECTK